MCPHVLHTRCKRPALPAPATSILGAEGTPVYRFQPSEGVFLYLLGLVVVASHPGRFWFGLSLALVPLVIGPLGRALGGRAWRDA
jgi:hypothetical protein